MPIPLRHLLPALALASAAFSAAGAGPDVIVGDLPDITHHTPPEADLQAYSVGTISCNVGDDVLQWVNFNAHHPVIAQNMFRLVTLPGGVTRFEQIGQSWVKHAQLAIPGTFCTICPPTSPWGSVLAVGCADPYSADLNGEQAILGPRSEINPATGVFPFPISWAEFPDSTGDGHGDPPPAESPTARRIQVARADLLATDALFFAEGHYVTQDDAAAANQNNNASYRRITINPATLDAALVDTTQRTRPAIYAWRDHGLGPGIPDPSVTITPIDVPNDGRFLVASRVVQTGPSTWHYAYAVQNLTSHRGAQSFAVSVLQGTQASNAGFRDVPYHSGEIWAGADWSRPQNGPQMLGFSRWSTIQPPAVNPRGNALRWGTLYTFWLDANQPPAPGQATITLFRDGQPGDPTAVRLALPTPGGLASSGPQPIHNDTCAAAAPIHNGQTAFSTLGATDDPTAECPAPGGGGSHFSNDAWFLYTHAGVPGEMVISTCGSSFHPRLAVYSACPTEDAQALACADTGGGGPAPDHCAADPLAAWIRLPAATGQSFLIRIGGSPDAAPAMRSGNGLLHIDAPGLPIGACCRVDGTCVATRASACVGMFQGDGTTCAPNPCPQPPVPPNDLCASAAWIADSVPITSTNAFATTDGSAPPCANGGVMDVWYRYLPAVSGDVRIATDNAVPVNGVAGGATNFDTSIAVYASCGGPLIDCDDDSGVNPEPSSDLLAVPMTAGQTYLIRVAGYPYSDPSRRVGVFTLKVIGGGGTIPTPDPEGACCTGVACAVTAPDACAPAGVYQGDNTACGPAGNPTTCCLANFNRVGGVSIQDLFDFLSAYFSADPAADVNGVGGVTVQDVFDFLAAWFAGC